MRLRERDNQGHFDPLCVSCKWVKRGRQLLPLYHCGALGATRHSVTAFDATLRRGSVPTSAPR